MARKFHLVPHLTVAEVSSRERRATDAVERTHWQLLRLVMEGSTVTAASGVVGYAPRYGRLVLTRYNQHGPHALLRKPRGRKAGSKTTALLDDVQRQALGQALLGPAPDGGLWTGPKVAAWLADTTGREKVWPQLGWDYLKRLGFSLRRPRPRHAKANADAQEAFKKTWQSG